MIIKDKEIKHSTLKHIQQGEEAEKQMAFYLKREFQDNKEVFVFNDVKFEYSNEIAQIDHLILTYYGFIIIESKSCVGKISYDNHDQWIRHYTNKEEGMASPIQQTKRQFQVFKNLLNNNASDLLDKFMFLQKRFGSASIDYIVSVADKTILNHPEERNENILKSDQVCERINNIINLQKKNNLKTKFFLNKEEDTVFKFKDSEVDNLVKFIQEKDINKIESKIEKQEKIINQNNMNIENKNISCKHDNKIHYGKYGYYFKCEKCNENTRIKEICTFCNSKNTKIRKSKNDFFLTCKDCNQESFYWKN